MSLSKENRWAVPQPTAEVIFEIGISLTIHKEQVNPFESGR